METQNNGRILVAELVGTAVLMLGGPGVAIFSAEAVGVLGIALGFGFSLLIMAYSGSAINALGQTYELRVIAATVIGGASLMGGSGTAYGAIVGAALLEVIRNALLMAGIDSNWQGAFVGLFIILAVFIGLRTTGGQSYLATLKDAILPRRDR